MSKSPLQILDQPEICEWKRLSLEAFTITLPAGLCPLDWQQEHRLLHLLPTPTPRIRIMLNDIIGVRFSPDAPRRERIAEMVKVQIKGSSASDVSDLRVR